MQKLKFTRKHSSAQPAAPAAKLPKAYQLFRTSLKEFFHNWKPYIKIIAVVAVPTDLVGLSSTLSKDPTTGSYITLAAIVMNVALIWGISQRYQTGKVPNVPHAYYDGPAALVRYILASVSLVVMLIPAALGGAIYVIGVLGGIGASSASEQVLVALIAFVIGSPSLFLMVRYGLGPIVTVREGLRPLAALGYSRRLTLGRFWPVAGRLALLLVFLMLLSIPVTVIAIVLSILKQSNLAVVVFEIITTLTALPISNIYLYNLLNELAGSPGGIKAATVAEPAPEAALEPVRDAPLVEPAA